MSQNSTVTCFISPGRVLTVPEIWGFGVSAVGAAESCRLVGSRGAPHCPQNL